MRRGEAGARARGARRGRGGAVRGRRSVYKSSAGSRSAAAGWLLCILCENKRGLVRFSVSLFLHRTLRYVPESSQDKIISDEDVFETLLKVFTALLVNDFSRQVPALALLPGVQRRYARLRAAGLGPAGSPPGRHSQREPLSPEEVLFRTLGFNLARERSSLLSAGTGVFVSRGSAPQGAVVAMYPGNETSRLTVERPLP